ncbi:MAG: HAMP domain-containing sensor histidine kinase [Paracoccaceae bacterium]|nr:HAMP domain-containing sensor histidine kinase [Paracoccaceae bacterium]
MVLNTLSGRFLILTIIFVMLAEIFIFVPSVARYREDYMMNRLERAQIASLALLATEEIDETLEEELLTNAGVLNVVLRRDEIRQLMLSSPIPTPIAATYDLREAPASELIVDALARLANPAPEVVRVIGNPVQEAGLLIEVTMETAPLRAAMIDYGIRILILSAVISIFTATLLFLAVRSFLVKPIRGVVGAMQSYAAAPEDARRIIRPTAGIRELREAEEALQTLQSQLTGNLRQKDRLAQLGAAVAKVSHDLRNILTSAQLFADRLETSQDPMVARMVPKLLNSVRRAVHLCEATLTFGKAEEAPPQLDYVQLADIVSEVVESERLADDGHACDFIDEVPPGLVLRADREQIYRVVSNLARNARQAMAATGDGGTITISAVETDAAWIIRVADTGPGLPPKAQENLFQPFSGSVRKGGSGLGLAISAELVRGHGGRLELERTGSEGTTFAITLPKTLVDIEAAE